MSETIGNGIRSRQQPLFFDQRRKINIEVVRKKYQIWSKCSIIGNTANASYPLLISLRNIEVRPNTETYYII